MKILFLGSYTDGYFKIAKYIRNFADDDIEVWNRELPADADFLGADFIVSYGYRHIIREPWLSKYALRMINLHIGLLPWNRGADPNYWSWRHRTPKGVTIHEIDAGIDKGPIVAQSDIGYRFNPEAHTLRSSYEALHAEMVALFAMTWPAIRKFGLDGGVRQYGGSFHRKGEMPHLPLGWDTPVSEIIGK